MTDAVEKVGRESRLGLAIGLIWEVYADRGFWPRPPIIGETVSVPCETSAEAPAAERQPAAPAAKPQPAPAPVAAEPAAPARAPAASERTKEVARVKAKRRAVRDDDED